MTLKIIGVIIVCYMLGNINFAIIISYLMRRDVRSLGSGNPGAMNMFRNFGFFIGATTLLLDALKGVLACLVGWFVLGEEWAFGADKVGMYIGAVSVVIGHCMPVVFGFKGGKGIAGTIGICFMFSPWVTLAAFVVGMIFILLTKMGTLTSFIIIGIPLIVHGGMLAQGSYSVESILVFTLLVITFFAHEPNMDRLFSGMENKTDIIGSKKK